MRHARAGTVAEHETGRGAGRGKEQRAHALGVVDVDVQGVRGGHGDAAVKRSGQAKRLRGGLWCGRHRDDREAPITLRAPVSCNHRVAFRRLDAYSSMRNQLDA
jgi:hypothetical protein